MADEILFVAFNQDASSLAVGSHKGYRLYALNQTEELQLLHETDLDDVCLIERLFSSSLITLVSQSAPRKLRVCHFQKGTEICTHSYTNTVLNVRLNRFRLVVCLEESLYIHNIRDMKVLHTIRDTPPNPNGLCELCPGDTSYLAYPGSSTVGEVQIFDAANLQAVAMFVAHDSPLAAMKFNSDGKKLATASEKGTVIRVFSVPSGERLFEFRRGVKRCVTIYSLAFSQDSLFLCASSNTETVHIFKLEHDPAAGDRRPAVAQPPTEASWMGYMNKISQAYLPAQVSDMLAQDRAYAVAHLPHSGYRNVAALCNVNKQPRLLVASNSGLLYVYSWNPTVGGECTLTQQHRLYGDTSTSESIDVPAEKAPGAAPGKSKESAQSNRILQNEVDIAMPGLKLDDSQEFPPVSHRAD